MLVYLNVSGTLNNYYPNNPTVTQDDKKWSWIQSGDARYTNSTNGWQLLNVSSDGPVRFGYAVVAGIGPTAPPAPIRFTSPPTWPVINAGIPGTSSRLPTSGPQAPRWCCSSPRPSAVKSTERTTTSSYPRLGLGVAVRRRAKRARRSRIAGCSAPGPRGDCFTSRAQRTTEIYPCAHTSDSTSEASPSSSS